MPAFLIAFFPVFSQTHANTSLQTDTTKYKVYQFVEENPEFPGGQEAAILYLKEKISHVNMVGKPEGKVILQLTITKTGSVEDLIVLKSLEPSLDQAALEAVKKMPLWIPGKQDGVPVRVRMLIPVHFAKDTGKSKKKRKSKN